VATPDIKEALQDTREKKCNPLARENKEEGDCGKGLPQALERAGLGNDLGRWGTRRRAALPMEGAEFWVGRAESRYVIESRLVQKSSGARPISSSKAAWVNPPTDREG